MWQLIYEKSPWANSPKLSRNLVSATHSFLSIALLTARHPIKYEIIVLNSVSYFIWDIIYMFRIRLEPLYVYHHLVCIWMLLSDLERQLICKSFLYGEVSNIFNYIVYHLLQTKKKCKNLRIIQSIWFTYFRIFKLTQLLLKYFHHSILFYNMITVYIMGVYWSGLQVKKLLV